MGGRATAATARQGDAWAPLRRSLFAALWSASLASNIGTWIENVAEKWQMASMTRSTLLIALIETGTTLPMLLLSLAAGAIADIVDRRRLLIVAQTYMMLVAAALAVLTFRNLLSPGVLIGMSLLLGIGAAVNAPAWQAIIPEILPREEVPAGVAINSAGFNVSRAIGPAIGGAIVGLWGPGWAFLLNSISFLGTVIVLRSWQRPAPTTDLPSERFFSAVKLGLRYARYRRPLQNILVKASGFVFFGGIVFSLLPSLAIHHLGLNSYGFGMLLGCVGAGAVTATLFMGPARRRLTTTQNLAVFTLLTSAGLATIALVQTVPVVGVALFACGVGWLSVLSTLNTAVQLTVPTWVKARAFGVYITSWGGALAIGATFWGVVAQHLDLPRTFGVAAGGLFVLALLSGQFRIRGLDEDLDLSPHRVAPHPPEDIAPDAGPILVLIQYNIPTADVPAFRTAMRGVRAVRIRDGAARWGLFEEPTPHADGSTRFIESFVSGTWGEHLRLHHRATVEDRDIFLAAYRLDPAGFPRVRHLVAAWEEPHSLFDRFLP